MENTKDYKNMRLKELESQESLFEMYLDDEFLDEMELEWIQDNLREIRKYIKIREKQSDNWEDIPINVAGDHDLVTFLWNLRIGMSKPNYTLGAITEQINNVYIRKSELINIYFDDLTNVCETREEMIDYINEVIKEMTE